MEPQPDFQLSTFGGTSSYLEPPSLRKSASSSQMPLDEGDISVTIKRWRWSLNTKLTDGKFPFQRWFASLGTKAALKITTAVAQMKCGNFGDHKSVGGGVRERRINFEKGYRIYYAKDGDELVILLCGGTKSRQQSDIDNAKELWSEYKKRRKQEKKSRKARQRCDQITRGGSDGTYTRFHRNDKRSR
jgi:putative addiction module killer protein